MNINARQYADYYRRNPTAFLAMLPIETKGARAVTFNRPHPEQIVILKDLMSGVREHYHVKSRQIGDTTINVAWDFAYAYWCPDPVKTMLIAHKHDSTDAIFRKIRGFYRGLRQMNQTLYRKLSRDNDNEMAFDPELDNGAVIRCFTAGGKHSASSWTFQRALFDEVALWTDAAAVYSDATSALASDPTENPHYQMAMISRPNGPGNMFHQQVETAMERVAAGDKAVVCRFFPWFGHAAYRLLAPPHWEPDADEEAYGAQFGLTPEQLYWRHEKLRAIGPQMFRREYPSTVIEGFLVFEGSWFDATWLNEVLASLPTPTPGQMLHVYGRPVGSEVYAIGVDPSWGTGGDSAVAQVVTASGDQVAVFQSNLLAPRDFAGGVAELSLRYNRARVMVESNPGGGGSVVVEELDRQGIPLWFGRDGRPWVTTAGNKRELLDFARYLVAQRAVRLRDWRTVKEMLQVREDPRNHRIEAPAPGHDDHALALALACWNARSLPSPIVAPASPRRYSRLAVAHPFV